MSIPAINLHAPVEEGTDDPELNVAVGHDPQSVWPGVDGAAVFLAHDVSYFVHLNALEPGDVITYATACNTVKFEVSAQQVVPAGSAVSNSADPSLVLDTCWPPNALFFTPDRLLVRATEVGAATKGTHLDPGAEFIKTVQDTDFKTSAPPALQAQGLTLEQNEAPMGTMNLVGASQAFAQSPEPLSLEAAALETYFGGLHAVAQRQAAWWSALAPAAAHAAHAGGGQRLGPRLATRRGDRLGGREREPGHLADHRDPERGLGPGHPRHDGRPARTRRCGDDRRLERGLRSGNCPEFDAGP